MPNTRRHPIPQVPNVPKPTKCRTCTSNQKALVLALKAMDIAKGSVSKPNKDTHVLEEAAAYLKQVEAETTAQWITDYSKPKGSYIA